MVWNSLARRATSWTILVAGLWVVLALATPAPLVYEPALPELPEDLDAWLESSEAEAALRYPLIPGTEKRIRWRQPGARTEFAVVYLHGFSATRQEISPVPDMVADTLGANLFETRLTGHGRVNGAMLDATAEDWLDDAAEAIAIGERIGERVIVVATSTGASLAVAMSGDARLDNVDSIVLISPNYGPKNENAKWLTRPAGPVIARLLVGETRTWKAHNAEQELFWSTSYPIAATVEVMRLVDRANSPASRQFSQNILMLYSPDDNVVSTEASLQAFERLNAPRKQAIAVSGAEDPSHHVLAGRILSPNKNDAVAAIIVEFLRHNRRVHD